MEMSSGNLEELKKYIHALSRTSRELDAVQINSKNFDLWWGCQLAPHWYRT
jgi:hypothetical protein